MFDTMKLRYQAFFYPIDIGDEVPKLVVELTISTRSPELLDKIDI